MARPKKADRTAVAGLTLTVRITEADRALLDTLVARQRAELDTRGIAASVSAADVVRTLIRREARGASPATAAEPKAPPERPKAAATRAHAPAARKAVKASSPPATPRTDIMTKARATAAVRAVYPGAIVAAARYRDDGISYATAKTPAADGSPPRIVARGKGANALGAYSAMVSNLRAGA